ncbi:MAG: MFS transporter [Clostridia bacterium]|nr:MFS transporter [Clostridia bacterium]
MSEQDLKRNVKVYPWYRAFAFDFLFLWTISILYLTEVKGLSYSQVILLDSVFMLSAFLLQIPVAKVIKKIGRSNATRIASVFSLGFVAIYLFGQGFWLFIIANLLYGLSMAIRNITDVEILSLSLKKLHKKNDYSKYEGKGMFWYYIFEGVTSIVAGYLYEFVSPYAPVIGTAVCALILMVLSFVIKDPLDDEEDILEQQQIEEKQRTREPSYKTLLKRPFVIWMAIFSFCFFGIGGVHQTMSKVYLQNINMPAYLFGYIFCVYKIIAGIASKFQFKYELKQGVKSIIIFSVMMLFGFTATAIIYSINPKATMSIIIVLILFATQHMSRAATRITIKNYINTCVSKYSLTRTLTIYSMAECLGYSLTTLFVSLVMELSGNSYVVTNLSIVTLFTIPIAISAIFFIRALIKSYISRCTTIRKDLE